MVATDPSPKSQIHAIGFPVDVPMKDVINGGWPQTGVAVNDAFTSTGAVPTVIYPVFVSVLPPAAFVAVRDTAHQIYPYLLVSFQWYNRSI
jgi:hypothetical protein